MVPAILKKYISKGVALEAAILKLSLQPVFMQWCHSVCLEIGGKERDLQLTWHPSQGQQNLLFSKGLSTPLSPMLSFQGLKHVWLKIMWHKSSHNPEWWLKGSSKAIWTKSVVRSDIMETLPGVLFKMTAMMFEFWAPLETNFIRKASGKWGRRYRHIWAIHVLVCAAVKGMVLYCSNKCHVQPTKLF